MSGFPPQIQSNVAECQFVLVGTGAAHVGAAQVLSAHGAAQV